ncbi:MAG: hypothetical protein ABJA71_16270 [Ginsengibacter sp.]
MKKIYILSFFVSFFVSGLHAQSQKLTFSIGPQVSVPTFNGINSTGIGGGFSIERFFSKKLTGFIDISLNYFNGNVLDHFKNDTIKGFTVMPVLAGAIYFFTDKFYLSGAAGIVIGLHNAGNHLALSPGTGILIPISATSKIDLGLKLIGIPTGYSFSENNFLNKGGYSFLTFRIAYMF